jgi:hypothetical protein
MLLLDIRAVFQTLGGGRLFSRTLVAALNDLGDRPWAELRVGLDISEVWLAKQLQPFGIRPRNIRISGKVSRGYFESDFKEAFQRYVPRTGAGPEGGGEKAEVSGQKEENKPDGNEQRTEIEGQKKDETGETPGGEAAAA